jgi:hypothetical protein
VSLRKNNPNFSGACARRVACKMLIFSVLPYFLAVSHARGLIWDGLQRTRLERHCYPSFIEPYSGMPLFFHLPIRISRVRQQYPVSERLNPRGTVPCSAPNIVPFNSYPRKKSLRRSNFGSSGRKAKFLVPLRTIPPFTGKSLARCPVCQQGRMMQIEVLSPPGKEDLGSRGDTS